MLAEEHTKLIQDIAQNLTDPVKVTAFLATLSKDYTETLGKIETLPKTIADNEILRKANMDLFLQVGSQAKTTDKPIEKVEEIIDPTKNKPDDKLKYEALFNDKGGLI